MPRWYCHQQQKRVMVPALVPWPSMPRHPADKTVYI